ncbi:heterokaryon incompatibility protein-domain-containing protein [Paraphoma chrysanthemicola]|uniref:Heterokaryon incompatibility protein-domain-containing protein n=1 Tax=Paraphoma chrysanthemicola TaxID=798071 RepID=A0A8K0RAI1_9PLEO|nr:heterokaryon incompatibility protein-domain-containing protein [Paraphoma chrysanthemicola]
METQRPIKRVDSVYTDSIDGVSIRLLRFSQPEEGVFVGKLKTFRLASAPHFYTASYVWGQQKESSTTIHLNTGSLPVLPSLVPFLHMVTQHADFDVKDWWWIDSLCINLTDGREREEQVRVMAEIYKRAKRAIVWLGEEQEPGNDCTGAISFLHSLGSLQVAFTGDDHAMRRSLEDPEFVSRCAAVSNLLFRPWWTRVWTLQEFVLPKEAKLYCGMQSISRGKFKSAIYSIFLCSTISNDFEHELVPRAAFDGAFNRRRIHQLHTKAGSQGISLVAIMAYLGNHMATDSRDRIFSVLGLITPRDRKLVGAPEYTTSTGMQFARLVRSFWNEFGSLDIICYVHLFSRYSGPRDPGPEDAVPWWAPDWRATIDFASPVPLMASQSANEYIGNFRPLRSQIWKAKYDAPGSYLRKRANVLFQDNLKEFWCDGVILDMIHGLGALDDRELRCQSFVCAEEGHSILQSSSPQSRTPRATMLPMDWLEAIARSLALDRKEKYLCFQAPQHYVNDFLYLSHACVADEPVDWSFSTWFDLNKQLKFGAKTLEELIRDAPIEFPASPPPLERPPSYPATRKNNIDSDPPHTYLSRFHDTARKKARRLMVTDEGFVGVAPCRARVGDVVAILYGCSIPLVLRKRGEREAWQVIGEAYVHGFMSGEVADLIRRGKKETHRFRLV